MFTETPDEIARSSDNPYGGMEVLEVASAMLMGVHRVSPAIAEALLHKFGSVSAVGAATEAEIAEVQAGKRALGAKLAARVRAALA